MGSSRRDGHEWWGWILVGGMGSSRRAGIESSGLILVVGMDCCRDRETERQKDRETDAQLLVYSCFVLLTCIVDAAGMS